MTSVLFLGHKRFSLAALGRRDPTRNRRQKSKEPIHLASQNSASLTSGEGDDTDFWTSIFAWNLIFRNQKDKCAVSRSQTLFHDGAVAEESDQKSEAKNKGTNPSGFKNSASLTSGEGHHTDFWTSIFAWNLIFRNQNDKCAVSRSQTLFPGGAGAEGSDQKSEAKIKGTNPSGFKNSASLTSGEGHDTDLCGSNTRPSSFYFRKVTNAFPQIWRNESIWVRNLVAKLSSGLAFLLGTSFCFQN